MNSQKVIGDVDVDKLTKDIDVSKIDLDMIIKIYWNYEDALKQVLKGSSSGGNGDFENKMKGFINDYFNEGNNITTSNVTFYVDYDTYRSTSGGNTYAFTIIKTAIVMMMMMITMI